VISIDIDAKNKRVDVDLPIFEKVDLRSLYSRVKESYFNDTNLCQYTFPFKVIGDSLLLEDGWTMRINDHEYKEAGIMIFQQDWE